MSRTSSGWFSANVRHTPFNHAMRVASLDSAPMALVSPSTPAMHGIVVSTSGVPEGWRIRRASFRRLRSASAYSGVPTRRIRPCTNWS